MSTSLGMILWVLLLGGILWANLSAKRGLDEARATGLVGSIERAACRYGNVLHAPEQFEDFTRGVIEE